ncbi:Major facilitator superfamily domain-containing protein 12 [Stylophora pistillata]|uniref:Major facilitator superfamily domain-containing protein 12 n=1 Tax=Stylophora pistillata TaxID=50429 RepID=A0A2B4SYC9_STYPI|nr:Major facilitator superfamily domain-containing protein 12 [Stylophora pistillata]
MGVPKLFTCFTKPENPSKRKDRTPLRQRVSYSTGHIFNDLCSAVWLTYFIVYFNKVVGLSTTDTGLLFLIAQGADAILTPFMGIGCDRLVIKRFAPYGVQIAHLSLIPEIARRPSEIVELNAIRSGLTFVCGIFIYSVTWILLGQASEEGISHGLWKEFTQLSLIVVAIGFMFSFVFHWGTIEPASSTTCKREELTQEPLDEHSSDQSPCVEIVERDTPSHKPKTWRQWFKDPRFYVEAIAYFPLVILISGAMSSVLVKGISKSLGTKWTFCLACAAVLGACTWFYFQTVSGRVAVYAAAFIMGSGNSVMLVTVLSMTADMIGIDKASGGFVYSVMGFLDKGFVGVVVLVIQTFYPDSPDGVTCEQCSNYVRIVFTLAPGISAVISLVIVGLCFKSKFVLSCRPRIEKADQSTQTTTMEYLEDLYEKICELPSSNV